MMFRSKMILAAFFLAFNVAFAQSPSDLKGPAAKNYKPWKHQARSGDLMTIVYKKAVKGPSYKNRNPWQDETKKSFITTDFRIRKKITGPKAKNKKPWESD